MKTDSATIKIFTAGNELIRTIKIKADTGFNRNYWGFEMKGVRQPGTPKPKASTPEPAGLPVYPGLYKMVIRLGNEADSAQVLVLADPGLPVSREIYDAKMVMIKRIEKSSARLTAITDQLTEAEDAITKIEAELKNIEGKDADSLRKTGKLMMDSIKSIRNYIMGKTQEKQGYGTPYQVTATGRLGEARNEVLGKTKIPDAQEISLIEEAELLADKAVKKTNEFFKGPWVQYQKQTESTPRKLFREYKDIE